MCIRDSGNRLTDFCAVMERMGAKKLPMGDASYEFEFINGYFVQFILWAGDDEFPPSAQILFSDNFPLSFSAEDMAVVGDCLLYTSCILCQAFSPSHVCVVTPERLGLCGAVSWLDAKATNQLDPDVYKRQVQAVEM